MTLFAVERHALGPRVHVLGRRVHECHLGLVLVTATLVGVLAGVAGPLCAALGALWAEGQLPAPRLPRRRTCPERRAELAPGLSS